jgi:hypothetical protein
VRGPAGIRSAVWLRRSRCCTSDIRTEQPTSSASRLISGTKSRHVLPPQRVTNARSSIPAEILAIRVPCPFPHTTGGELGHKKAPATALCALDIDLSVGFATSYEARISTSKPQAGCYSLCDCADDPAGKCCHGDDPKFTRVPTEWSHSLEVHLRGRRCLAATCVGGVPNGAKSLVLIIDAPDAPDPKAPKMVWVHGSSTTYRPIPRACPRT